MSEETTGLDPCRCYEAALPEPVHYNRPGLPALSYRIGAHAAFMERMLARLSRPLLPDGPTLAGLTTRSTEDPAIALLDAWAVAADVLAFYQERIANEGYLLTATERRSVLELARAIGYELNPGVAASVYLTFTVEDAPGAPGRAVVPKGTKAQSIPSQGKLPQTFETVSEITALAEWNALKPRLTRPQDLAVYQGSLYLLGTSGSLASGSPGVEDLPVADIFPVSPGTALEGAIIPAVRIERIYLKGTETRLKAGERLLMVGKKVSGAIEAVPFPILRVEAETAEGRTRVDLTEQPPAPPLVRTAYKAGVLSPETIIFTAEHIQSNILNRAWRNRDLEAFLTMNRWNAPDMKRQIAAPPPPKLPPADQGIFAFEETAGFFGHNAPRQETLPIPENTRGGGEDDPYAEPWDGQNERTIWTGSQGESYTDADVYLERSLPGVLDNSWVLVESGSGANPLREAYRVSAASEASLVDYAISGKATGLNLETPDGNPPPKDPASQSYRDFKVRKSSAYVRSRPLELAELPVESPLESVTTDEAGNEIHAGAASITLDKLVLGLQVGQPVMLSGEQLDAAGVIRHEAAILKDILHEGGFTTLTFQNPLAYRYVLKTVTLNANVAPATHGETVQEAMGSGDGAQPNQRFVLKKPLLTYVSAETPRGSASTLSVRVDGVLWEEAPSLYGLDARSQSYIVRSDNEAKAAVTFGDGASGARLPSGSENVIATYRSGIGPEGEVEAGSITLLQTRPLGVRGVTNPLLASGAAPPETLDDARARAPQTVLTLDRIVSLRDFEDFARSFAGIGKAQAVALWQGQSRLVHITVADAGGDPVLEADPLMTNLRRAIDGVRDPAQKVIVAGFKPVLFHIEAKVLPDPRYLKDTVLGSAEAALQAAFSFVARAFGQPVTAAEVVTVIQKVAGVTAVDLERLYLATDPAGPVQTKPAVRLNTATAALSGSGIAPAEILLVNPVGIVIGEMETEP
ncbi:MAG: putative baseplate assembly protein [Armatimonadetes bacterium]|nr:putative baseplate assembly protein [Armatimonadota bacterium]